MVDSLAETPSKRRLTFHLKIKIMVLMLATGCHISGGRQRSGQTAQKSRGDTLSLLPLLAVPRVHLGLIERLADHRFDPNVHTRQHREHAFHH